MAQCTAHRKNSDRCKNDAIKGGSVCRVHGGSAKQVREAAQRRLATLVDPAIGTLAKSLKSKQGNVALGAARDILDRAGFKPTDKTEIEQKTTHILDPELRALLVKALPYDYVTDKRKATESTTA